MPITSYEERFTLLTKLKSLPSVFLERMKYAECHSEG